MDGFPLPQITYPLKLDTIGKLIATGHEVTAYCNAYGCRHSGRLNLVMLGRKLGMDHGSLARDLLPHIHCPKCREAGRNDRDLQLILSAPTWPHSVLRGKIKGGDG